MASFEAQAERNRDRAEQSGFSAFANIAASACKITEMRALTAMPVNVNSTGILEDFQLFGRSDNEKGI
jgi:hypothetical protein